MLLRTLREQRGLEIVGVHIGHDDEGGKAFEVLETGHATRSASARREFLHDRCRERPRSENPNFVQDPTDIAEQKTPEPSKSFSRILGYDRRR